MGKGLLTLFLAIFLVAFPLSGDAKIALSTVIVDFEPGKPPFHDVIVTNISEEKVYVQVDIMEVINPGRKNQEKKLITSKAYRDFIVSPRKLVLPPKGSKRLRYITQHSDIKEDKIYRVKVAPVVGDIKATESILKVLIAYETLVIIRPKALDPQLKITRKGKTITATNMGNTSVLLRKGKQCNQDKSICKDLPGKRIYAGMRWTEKLPLDAPVDYTYSIGEKAMLYQIE